MDKIETNSLYGEICTNAHIRLMNRQELLKTIALKQCYIMKQKRNISEALEFIDRYLSLNLDEFNASSLLRKIREILLRGDDYPKEE